MPISCLAGGLPDLHGMQEVWGSNPPSFTPFWKSCSSRGAKRGATGSCGLGFLPLVKDGVHGLGPRGDHGLELVPVNPLGNRRALVSDQVSDGLDGYAVIAHDGYERVA